MFDFLNETTYDNDALLTGDLLDTIMSGMSRSEEEVTAEPSTIEVEEADEVEQEEAPEEQEAEVELDVDEDMTESDLAIIDFMFSKQGEETGYSGVKNVHNSDISWLNTKTNNVNLSGLNSNISRYLTSLPEDIRSGLVATSGNDDKHAPNSKHYNNNAIDLRYNERAYNFIKNDPTFKQLGLKLLDPNHGTAQHLHIETMKYGGQASKYQVNGEDPIPKIKAGLIPSTGNTRDNTSIVTNKPRPKTDIMKTRVRQQMQQAILNKPVTGVQKTGLRNEYQKQQAVAKAKDYWDNAGYNTNERGEPVSEKLLTKVGNSETAGRIGDMAVDMATIGSMIASGGELNLLGKGVQSIGGSALNVAQNYASAGKPLTKRLMKPMQLIDQELTQMWNDTRFKQKWDVVSGEMAIADQYRSDEAKRRMANYLHTDEWVKPKDLKVSLTKNKEVLQGDNQGIYYNIHPSNPEYLQGRAFVNANKKEVGSRKSTAIHELTHKLTNSNDKLSYALQNDLTESFVTPREYAHAIINHFGRDVSDETYNNAMKQFKYYTIPTEIHARINELRHWLNPGNPYKKIDTYELQRIINAKDSDELPSNVGNMLNLIYDWDKFGRTLNKVPAVAPIAVGVGATAIAAQDNTKNKYTTD